jgi:hypothetical protein
MRPASRLAGRSFTGPALLSDHRTGVPGVVLLANTRVTWACGVRQVSRYVTVLFVAVSTPVMRWQPRARRDDQGRSSLGPQHIEQDLSSSVGVQGVLTGRRQVVCRVQGGGPQPSVGTPGSEYHFGVEQPVQRLHGNVWEVDNRGTQSLAATGVGMMASRRRLGWVRACRPPRSAEAGCSWPPAVRSWSNCMRPAGTAVRLYS